MPKRDDKIQFIKISELSPYENNARTHSNEQIEAICNSIKEFGFINPVIIDENNMILVGHGRIEAAKVIGLDEAPYRRVTNLTEDQKRAYILADNKLSDLGGWDEALLAQELGEIELDMSLFGFDDIKVEDLNLDTDDIQADELPDIDSEAEPRAKRGDIYRLGNHYLLCGDSTSESDVKRLLSYNKGSVDLCLTDAPYGVNIVKPDNRVGNASLKTFEGKVGFGEKGKNKLADCGIYMAIKGDDTTDTARKFYEIIKSCSNNQIFFGGNYFTDFLPPRACWLVWDKQNSGNFADAELAWTSFNTGVKIYPFLWNGMSREGDRKTELKKRVHPTQKPVGMLVNILNDYSKEGNTIIDGFGGSGSTLIACEQTGRSCFMIEYEPYYIDVIIKRWEDYTGERAELIKEA